MPRRRKGSSATPRCSAAWCTRWREALLASEAEPRGVVDSGLPGPKGNQEFVLHLVHVEQGAGHATLPAEFERWVDDAVG